MKLRIPSYYEEFSCIADKCKDNCCIGWEIDIDEETYSYYSKMPGELGDRLRKNIAKDSDGTNHFILDKNGFCPFLNEQKLCDICIHAGEEALSEVCTEYPRFVVEYEDVREKVLCLSCEEVGRIVFSKQEKVTILERELPDIMQYEEDDEEEESDAVYAKNLEQARAVAIEILQDRTQPIRDRIVQYLYFGKSVQDLVSTEQIFEHEIEKDKFLTLWQKDKRATENFSYEAFLERMMILEELEVLDHEWRETTKKLRTFFSKDNYATTHAEFLAGRKKQETEYEQLLVYFTFRYFMKAYYDYNVFTKVVFAVVSYLTILDMSIERVNGTNAEFTLEDMIDVARIYAKEVEHSEENMDLMAEEFAFDAIYQLENIVKEI